MMTCKLLQDYMVSSALGALKISSCSQGLHSLSIADESKKTDIEINSNVPAKLIEESVVTNSAVLKAVEWLTTYFCNPLQLENIKSPPICPVAAPRKDSFAEAVWQTMAIYVPFGSTVTYQKLAEMANFPNAFQAVGSVMRKNNLLLLNPCHRVVRSDGKIGRFSAGDQYKKFLLNHERSSLL